MDEMQYQSFLSPMLDEARRFRKEAALRNLDVFDEVHPILTRTCSKRNNKTENIVRLMVLDEPPNRAIPLPSEANQINRGTQAVKSMLSLKYCEDRDVD
jgi:hypothetical protein